MICMMVTIVLIAAVGLPVLSGLVLFVLLPACLTYSFVRFDMKYAALLSAVTLLLPMLFAMQFDLSVFLACVPFAAALAFAVQQRKGLLFTVSAGVVGEIVAAILLFLSAAWAAVGVDAFFAQIGSVWAEVQEQMAQMLAVYEIPSEVGVMYQQMFLSLLPAMAVCMMAACSYFAFYLCGVALRRRAAAYAGICRPFSELKADKSCVFAVVIFFVVSLFVSGVFAKALVNIVVILAFFLFVCGFSVICFFVKRIQNKPLRVAAFVVLFLTLFVTSYLFLFVGFVDAFLNIRRLFKEQGSE